MISSVSLLQVLFLWFSLVGLWRHLVWLYRVVCERVGHQTRQERKIEKRLDAAFRRGYEKGLGEADDKTDQFPQLTKVLKEHA